MKKFLKISWDIDNTPAHLLLSLIMAFGMMMLVNIFIGSMGGVSAFIAFTIVFYSLRGFVNSGNRISHQLGMSSRREIMYMLRYYACIYLLVWAGMKLLIFFSTFNGWGNVNGLTIGEYAKRLYGSTMMEGWAYFVAAILMFTFVISLFPLIVIKKKKTWLCYLLIDVLLFIAVCGAIVGICGLFIQKELAGRATCVLDELLLCRPSSPWQAFGFVFAAIVFALAVGYAVFCYAAKCYAPQPGKICTEEQLASERKDKHRKRNMVAGIAGCFAAALAVFAVFRIFFGESDSKLHYYKVAECLTEDKLLGPMVYGGNIYIPVDEELDYYETGKAIGYLAYKDEDCDSRLYELTVANLLYKNAAWEDEYLQMYGADVNSYRNMAAVEKENAWEQDEVFLLWDEEWESEMFYSKEPTGYCVCEKNMIQALEDCFGEVNYRPADFESCDAYFSIRGYNNLKEALAQDVPYGNWVGCILVRDDKFYYGNYSNEITGDLLDALMEVLAG